LPVVGGQFLLFVDSKVGMRGGGAFGLEVVGGQFLLFVEPKVGLRGGGAFGLEASVDLMALAVRLGQFYVRQDTFY
jgi:hypothetical protein